jgi:hypothetical protein
MDGLVPWLVDVVADVSPGVFAALSAACPGTGRPRSVAENATRWTRVVTPNTHLETGSFGDVLVESVVRELRLPGGLCHSALDLPARTWTDGSLGWIEMGRAGRRGDGPAVVWPSGRLEWYQNNRHHRVGGPAVVDAERNVEEWWFEGRRHRVGGPAVVDGTTRGHVVEEWWRHGVRHRADGPAVVDGHRHTWFVDGVMRRYQDTRQGLAFAVGPDGGAQRVAAVT